LASAAVEPGTELPQVKHYFVEGHFLVAENIDHRVMPRRFAGGAISLRRWAHLFPENQS
jgi:hypothetical protein